MGDLRAWVFVAMILGGSFIAGCCGGGGDDGGCAACAEQAETGPTGCQPAHDGGTDAADAATSD
jgi:hypothetical protein